MKRIILTLCPLLLVAAVPGCKTLTVNPDTRLAAKQSFAKAEVAYKTAQTAALACIKSGTAFCVTNKDAIISANHTAQGIEDKALAAEQIADQVALGNYATALGAATTQILALTGSK